MHRHYYGFEIYSRAEPVPTTLLGRVTQWYATATKTKAVKTGIFCKIRMDTEWQINDGGVSDLFGYFRSTPCGFISAESGQKSSVHLQESRRF